MIKSAEGSAGLLHKITKLTDARLVPWEAKRKEWAKHWQCACTTMFFLIPKNVTSERPIALKPTLIRWWEAFESTRGGEVAAEVPC